MNYFALLNEIHTITKEEFVQIIFVSRDTYASKKAHLRVSFCYIGKSGALCEGFN